MESGYLSGDPIASVVELQNTIPPSTEERSCRDHDGRQTTAFLCPVPEAMPVDSEPHHDVPPVKSSE